MVGKLRGVCAAVFHVVFFFVYLAIFNVRLRIRAIVACHLMVAVLLRLLLAILRLSCILCAWVLWRCAMAHAPEALLCVKPQMPAHERTPTLPAHANCCCV